MGARQGEKINRLGTADVRHDKGGGKNDAAPMCLNASLEPPTYENITLREACSFLEQKDYDVEQLFACHEVKANTMTDADQITGRQYSIKCMTDCSFKVKDTPRKIGDPNKAPDWDDAGSKLFQKATMSSWSPP